MELVKLCKKPSWLLVLLQVENLTAPKPSLLTCVLRRGRGESTMAARISSRGSCKSRCNLDDKDWNELRSEQLKSSLSSQTVLLRLKAGSTEAGYLAAIFPLPKIPTLVLIKYVPCLLPVSFSIVYIRSKRILSVSFPFWLVSLMEMTIYAIVHTEILTFLR